MFSLLLSTSARNWIIMRIHADYYSTQRHIRFQPVILFWRAVGTSQWVLWANFKAFFLLFISCAEKIHLSTYLHWSVSFCSNSVSVWLPLLFVSTQINSVSKTASIFIWIWIRLEHNNSEDTYLEYLFVWSCWDYLNYMVNWISKHDNGGFLDLKYCYSSCCLISSQWPVFSMAQFECRLLCWIELEWG